MPIKKNGQIRNLKKLERKSVKNWEKFLHKIKVLREYFLVKKAVESFLGILFILIVIVGSYAMIYHSKVINQFSYYGNPALGNPYGKVAIFLYSDFQGTVDKHINKILLDIVNANEDHVFLVYKDFPSKEVHPNSWLASMAAHCSFEQGDFWNYHDLLYSRLEEWHNLDSPFERFVKYGEIIGLNINDFKSCMEGEFGKDLILKDISEGIESGVNVAPSIILNQEKIERYKDYDDLNKIISQKIRETL